MRRDEDDGFPGGEQRIDDVPPDELDPSIPAVDLEGIEVWTASLEPENVLVAATHGRARSDGDPHAAAAAALERVGLLGKANALARTLTLLERKRLELARAVVTSRTHTDVVT